MHVVPKACDDMMQIGRLQNFDGNLNAQGKLIYQVDSSILSSSKTKNIHDCMCCLAYNICI